MSVEADKAVSDDADCDDDAVFEQDIYRVLLLREASLEGGKTKVHQKHKSCSDTGPEHGCGEEVEGVGVITLACNELIVASFCFSIVCEQ